MVFYKNLEQRKEIVRNYIKVNPRATFSEIKKNLHIKIDRLYSGGMEEAFEDANVKIPRTFKKLTSEEKRKILINYIRENPSHKGHIIRKNTKINFLTIFKNTKEMFEIARVPYTEKSNVNLIGKHEEREKILVKAIRNNPFIGIDELMNSTKLNVYHHFTSIAQLYQKAGVTYLGKGAKKKAKKVKEVIDYVRKNNFSTQREINRDCRTKVQGLFDGGIFEAYNQAHITFPYERLNLHGAAIKEVRHNADLFEQDIAKKLSGYGNVNRLIRTKTGVADVVLERKGKKVVIEIKNYKSHDISVSQINQLNRYLIDMNLQIGFLVCIKKPKRDTFLIGKNKVFVLEESELNKIPSIIDEDP